MPNEPNFSDDAVTQAINLANDTTPDETRKIYLLAHTMGCKGITVYRYDSKMKQVLSIGSENGIVR